MLKIFRSSKAAFEHDAERADLVYSEDELQRIADAGFNAVWIRGIYRELLTHPRYPEFGRDSARLLRNLNLVAERGAACGVKLVIYNQEPLGLPENDPFWEAHPDMGGTTWGYLFGVGEEAYRMRAMCMTSEEVRDYLRTSAAQLLREVPGIAAIITITASEFMSHCFSHHGLHSKGPVPCPRCAEAGRRAVDVVVDVLNDMRDGMDRTNPDTPLIAWNWSWAAYEEDPQPSIFGRIRPGIHIQADFERGDWITDPLGKRIEINEYSLSYVGPSKRFLLTREEAHKQQRPVYAKLQIGTTHELATVSNLPLITRLYEKATAFKQLGLAGFMGCWNFGNMLSLNTRAFNFFLGDTCPEDATEALETLARNEFPGCDAASVVEAWYGFGKAFDLYPFSIPFLYHSPINYSLALPMRPGPLTPDKLISRSWLMDERDDNADPSRSFGPFTAGEIVDRLERMAVLWGEALATYEKGLEGASGQAVTEELSVARCIDVSLRSVRNTYRLHLLKRQWSDACRPTFLDIIADEVEVLREAIPLYAADPRQGYHIEAQGAMVTPELMQTKLQALEELLAAPDNGVPPGE